MKRDIAQSRGMPALDRIRLAIVIQARQCRRPRHPATSRRILAIVDDVIDQASNNLMQRKTRGPAKGFQSNAGLTGVSVDDAEADSP
jgi:hypothetical protein